MVIAGGLAGMGGAFAILAPSTIQGSSMTYEPISVIAANGFNGIAVALLGFSNPLGIIFSALFVSHIQRGGTLASLFGYKPEIIDVVIAVIIYFSAFAMLMNATLAKLIKNIRGKKQDSNNKRTETIPPKVINTLTDPVQEENKKETVYPIDNTIDNNKEA
jgi:ABC-type uncharacterized transport system permease subunit